MPSPPYDIASFKSYSALRWCRAIGYPSSRSVRLGCLFFDQHPRIGLLYLRRAHGCQDEEIHRHDHCAHQQDPWQATLALLF